MAHPPQIPLTPQTDERNFPRWQDKAPPGQSGHGYPKMLTRKFTKDEREAWRDKHRRIDVTTRQEYFEERIPKVGDPVPVLATEDLVDAGIAILVGEPVVVANADEEKRALGILGDQGVEVETPATSFTVPISNGRPSDSALEKLRQENADLEAALKRNEELKRELSGGDEPAPKQAGRGRRRGKHKIIAGLEEAVTHARGRKRKSSALQSLQEFADGGEE